MKMGHGLNLILLTGLLTVGGGQKVLAQTADELYRDGQTARMEQRFDDAVSLLESARTLDPDNADVLVQLGFAQLGLGNSIAARQAFEHALAIAPAYEDARFGLAQIEFRNGNLAEARRLAEAVVGAQPDNGEAQQLRASIAAAERAGPPTRWRVDIGTEVSSLTGGRLPWTDSSFGISYALQPQTTVGGRLRLGTRYGETDIQVEARLDHVFSEDFSAYGLVAATPDADFLARFSFGGGASWRASAAGGPLGPLVFTLDGRHDVFHDTSVTMVSPAAQYFFLDERLGLQVRWIHSVDDRGNSANGYAIRAEFAATDRLRLHAGYSDAPEISEGTQIDTKTVFTGVSFDLSDTVTLRAKYAYEHRETFNSNSFGLGLAVRF